ncbi:hypothetical protein J6590_103483 [Homalodisca vitripennis]|nr:hypothetical protein J6590_103483 [Homalodisca vitripennis]
MLMTANLKSVRLVAHTPILDDRFFTGRPNSLELNEGTEPGTHADSWSAPVKCRGARDSTHAGTRTDCLPIVLTALSPPSS